jgi:hypothetical protein
MRLGLGSAILPDLSLKSAGPVCIEVEDRTYEAVLASRGSGLVQSARYLRQCIATGA